MHFYNTAPGTFFYCFAFLGEGKCWVFLSILLHINWEPWSCWEGEAHVSDILRVCVTTIKARVCLPLACPAELASGEVLGKDEHSKGLTFYYQPQKGTFGIPLTLVFLFYTSFAHRYSSLQGRSFDLSRLLWTREGHSKLSCAFKGGDFGSKIGH